MLGGKGRAATTSLAPSGSAAIYSAQTIANHSSRPTDLAAESFQDAICPKTEACNTGLAAQAWRQPETSDRTPDCLAAGGGGFITWEVVSCKTCGEMQESQSARTELGSAAVLLITLLLLLLALFLLLLLLLYCCILGLQGL